MAHYARLNEHNVVEQVVVIANEDEPTEAAGEQFCKTLFGGGIWKKTSYNGNIRKNYAGIGYYYDVIRDAFIPPRPFASWTFNEDLCRWQAPVPMPNHTELWRWDEMSVNWVKMS